MFPMATEAQERVEKVIKERDHYDREAYIFMTSVITRTINVHGGCANAHQICEEAKRKAIDAFGYLAKTVFKVWKVESTDDMGVIMSDLVKAGIFKEDDDDDLMEFGGIYTIAEAFDESIFRFTWHPMTRGNDPQGL